MKIVNVRRASRGNGLCDAKMREGALGSIQSFHMIDYFCVSYSQPSWKREKTTPATCMRKCVISNQPQKQRKKLSTLTKKRDPHYTKNTHQAQLRAPSLNLPFPSAPAPVHRNTLPLYQQFPPYFNWQSNAERSPIIPMCHPRASHPTNASTLALENPNRRRSRGSRSRHTVATSQPCWSPWGRSRWGTTRCGHSRNPAWH